MEFSKIDKKVLIWLIAVLVIAALAGIAAYMRLVKNAVEVQNSAGGASTENNESQQNSPDIELELGDAQVEGGAGSGGLIICSDRCGDNVCQTEDPECPGENSLNCVCLETPEECPQDCE